MARISDILLRCPKDGRLVKLLDHTPNSMYGGVSSSIRSGKKSQVKTTSKTSKEMGCLDQTIIRHLCISCIDKHNMMDWHCNFLKLQGNILN